MCEERHKERTNRQKKEEEKKKKSYVDMKEHVCENNRNSNEPAERKHAAKRT